MESSAERKRLGAYFTPDTLVRAVVDAVVTADFVAARTRGGGPLRVVDPACGDGRFLVAIGERVRALGATVLLHGVDIDPATVESARSDDVTVTLGDALTHDWTQRYDLVIGNPPFLSQMAASTTRGGTSSRSGGPYADAAVEFLALAAELVERDGGRVAFVLPQSVLASRDAATVRTRINEQATLVWSWWTGERVFDAQVNTCVVAFEFGRGATDITENWARVVTHGVPAVPATIQTAGRLCDRAQLNANFRDEYYGMIPAVGDHPSGPRLITSGLIDPGRSLWGARPITFARTRWERPRLDLDCLDDKMREWARRRLVPKVLIANQTKIIEAVCDPDGEWLPAVPVVAAYPNGAHWDASPGGIDRGTLQFASLERSAWDIAAVLSSAVASAWMWHRSAGTGLSATSVRMSPVVLADLPWPAGELSVAVAALQAGDLRGCAVAVDTAYGVDPSDGLFDWWSSLLEGVEARQPTVAPTDADPSVPAAPAG